jgi:hypothetical protein
MKSPSISFASSRAAITPNRNLDCFKQSSLGLQPWFKQADKAFALTEGEPVRIVEHPAPRAAELPLRWMPLHAVDDIDHANDAAELKLVRQSDVVILFDVLGCDSGARRVTPFRLPR